MSSKLTIRVTVIRAEGVSAKDINGKSDPYVVLGWKDTPKKMQHKTKVQKATLNPVWNDTFDLPYLPKNTKLEIKVWDHDAVSKPDFLGYAEITLQQIIEKSKEPSVKIKLGPKPTKPKAKVSGYIFLRFQIPSELLETKEFKSMRPRVNLGTDQLAKIHKEFVIGGKQKTLKNKHDIVQAAKRCGLFALMQELNQGTTSSQPIEGELQDALTNDPVIETITYNQIMQVFDTNHDGEISMEEMISAVSILSSGSRADRAELGFVLIDSNGDGVLDYQELLELQKITMKAFRAGFIIGFKWGLEQQNDELGFSKEQIDQLALKIADSFASDQIAKISAKLCMKHFDKDGDGKITKKEYIEWFCDDNARSEFKATVANEIAPLTTEWSKGIQRHVKNFIKHNL
eukprot:TRINITY_DN9940_c0_g1_i2.p1 TRINITY_DN9940_c0_g1~~TRINITY_DN9940_c0_g1_i2.p1  ORF type:complete len:401 (-),score=72.97 TRINITY_DN9940_c0_g1_i2:15-1217(-)